ncbi:DUF6265 family protein [Salegentibacter sp. F188]|uniref:DUF6265 family protein n=1 Tax=Autumnicola patrickiae TaxID=3075591 RepID=A0ABU3E3D5_9FLAO|nr:DUF6265 family protein [Salegentibacter sp. F188]MDT0690489.1 DUF6265 family protein [Salegentibacter sp. F188]
MKRYYGRNFLHSKIRAALTFSIVLLLFSCGNSFTRKSNEDHAVSFDWIMGSWIRTNDTSNNQTFETWKKKSSGEYTGFGYTLNSGDTIFQENLRIFNNDISWNLEVTGEDGAPALFPILDFSSEKFTAVNKENDFPKKIVYELRNSQLLATIADEETEIPFVFSKAATE